jgi:HD-GYP domain-containing protein (c-di-GMP phosphodiesterase class II)
MLGYCRKKQCDRFLKRKKLSFAEFEVIKEHSSISHKILNNVFGFQDIAKIILHHHERNDGNGYPQKLQEKEISIRYRIIQLADSFDATASTRSYRKNYSFEETIEEILKQKGKQFDPEVSDYFIKIVSMNYFKKKYEFIK